MMSLARFGVAVGMLWVGLLCGPAHAGGGPENVAVIVNRHSWASRAIANEFVRLRYVPLENVVYLDNVPDIEQTTVAAFRDRILLPALTAIESRGVANHIDYVVYSSDLPSAIDVKADLGDRQPPKLITTVASINGLTYLYPYVIQKNPNYLRLDVNRYMRLPLAVVEAGALTQEQQADYDKSLKLVADKNWQGAADILQKLSVDRPRLPHVHYNLACCLARLDKPEPALAALQAAVAQGWSDIEQTERDEDLASLREKEAFKKLLTDMQQPRFEVQPTRGFRSNYFWNAQGAQVPRDGERYLLSTMLAVTSGRGNSVTEAISYLNRSAAADGTQPKGTIYFVENDDARSKPRKGSFPAAVAALEKLGVKAEILPGKIPQNKPDVQGAMLGVADFDWPASNNVILPGAICEHLTSLGGVMRERGGQTPLSDLLRGGAAGASGTVTEPYALQSKFPFPFVHVHYARGCTLAEAFYQSVQGPYQLLIVGDPLCRPWAKIPEVEIHGLTANQAVRGTVNIRATVKGRPLTDVGRYEVFVDGRRAGVMTSWESLELDTLGFAEGHHELRVVAVAGDEIETQGRAIVPFFVANEGLKLDLQATSNQVRWNEPLELKVKLAHARQISILHQSEILATINAPEGTATVKLAHLGPGPVTLRAIGVTSEPRATRVISVPVTIEILPPAPLPALADIDVEKLTPGLQLTSGELPAVTVEDTYPRDWLSKLALPAGQAFTLAGLFEVKQDETYQFQLQGTDDLKLEVDGQTLEIPANTGWRLVPVTLAKGWHEVQLTGTSDYRHPIQVRFGGAGALALSKDQFFLRKGK